MTLAEVLDHVGVVDRDVGGTPLEVVGDRIAAVGHHPLDELVRLADGRLGLVDEACLHLAPLRRIPLSHAV